MRILSSRQRHHESRPRAPGALHCDIASVRTHYFTCDGKAEPRAPWGPTISHIEALEETRQVVGVDPRPIIHHAQPDRAVGATTGSQNDLPTGWRMLESIVDEVGKHLLQTIEVAQYGEFRRHVRHQLYLLLLRPQSKDLHALIGQLGQLDRLLRYAHLPGLQAG